MCNSSAPQGVKWANCPRPAILNRHVRDELAYTLTMLSPIRIFSWASILVLSAVAGAAGQASPPDWTEPFPPFHIAGNLYYVRGARGWRII